MYELQQPVWSHSGCCCCSFSHNNKKNRRIDVLEENKRSGRGTDPESASVAVDHLPPPLPPPPAAQTAPASCFPPRHRRQDPAVHRCRSGILCEIDAHCAPLTFARTSAQKPRTQTKARRQSRPWRVCKTAACHLPRRRFPARR